MKSLRKLIVALILALTVVSSGLFLWRSITTANHALKSTYESDLAATAKLTALNIQTDVQRYYDVMNQMSKMKTLSDPDIPMEVKQDELDAIVNNNSDYVGINMLNTDGVSRVGGSFYVPFNESPFWFEPMDGRNYVEGPSINYVTNELTMYYGTPMYGSNGKIIGTMLIVGTGDILCRVCQNVTYGKTGKVVIIHRDLGTVAGDVDKEKVMNGFSYYDEIEADETGTLADFKVLMEDLREGNTGGGYYTYDGVKKYMSYVPVEGTVWSVLVSVDYDEFQEKLQGLRNNIFFIGALVIIVGLLIAFFVGLQIKPLKDVGDAINEIASGNADLTQRLTVKHSKAEILYVVEGFNKFVEKLQGIVANIKASEDKLETVTGRLTESSDRTSSSINAIIDNINNVSTHIEEQSNSINETASAMNQISANMQSFERMIGTQSDGVQVASTAVEEMVGNINSVNVSVEKMVAAFKDLAENANTGIKTQGEVNTRIQQIDEQSKMLQDANTAIANIASQTNLLAMNAAIEAAHAGEAGKGFSVVADEIRKLSETSTAQSKSIGEELKKIKDSINNVVSSSVSAASAFASVSESIESTDEILQQIRGAMEEQQIGSRQIIDALHGMNDSTTEVKNASDEMQTGNLHITKEIESLQVSAESMNEAIGQMATGAEDINSSGETLSAITSELTDSIKQISDEIGQFKV